MDGGDRINGFDFDNHRVLDHQVHSIAEIEPHPAIHDRKTNLCRRLESRVHELILQTCDVGALQIAQGRAQNELSLQR